MSDRTYHDAETGQFVSPEYAADNPATTVVVTSHAVPVDPVTEKLAAITARTDSQVSWSGTILGITRTGVSPEEIVDRLTLEVDAIMNDREVTR